jgi:hypothetical protein
MKDEGKLNENVAVILWSLNMGSSPKALVILSPATLSLLIQELYLEGVFDLKPYVTDIMVGNNETMLSVSKGQYKGHDFQKDGTSVYITLQDVLYIPKPMVSLFSLTKAIENTDVALSCKGQIISLTVGTTKIYFDKVLSMVQEVYLRLKCVPLPITFLPPLRLWTSMLYMKCLAIATLKYLQPLLLNMVLIPEMIFMFVRTVLSARPNRRISTS